MRDKERHYRGESQREERNESIRRNCKVTVVIGGARELWRIYTYQRVLNVTGPKIVFILDPTKPPSSYD